MMGAASCAPAPIVFDGDPYPRVAGETRALVLWVRFASDDTAWPGVTAANRGWQGPDDWPAIADSILSPSVERPTGLTRYFLDQSDGAFRLTGRSYPEVLVTREPERAYRSGDGTLDQARLTRELLESVDASDRVDLDDFDADRDGYIDYLFVVVRRMQETLLFRTHAFGISDLGYSSEVAEFGASKARRVDRHASGSYVRYDNAGNIFPEVDLVRLMAHEIGHDLWRGFVHLQPVEPAAGIPSFPDRRVGYVLMSGPSDARGDETISAFERDLLGWIDCRPLTRDTVVTVQDLYSGDADQCFTYDAVRLSRTGGLRRLYLSNRQRVGPFDRLMVERHPQARSEQGLMDTGVLVMATEGDGRVGVVPADGSLELSPRAAPYRGDLLRPGDRLTPWTHPNSTGYVGFPASGPRVHESQTDLLYRGVHVLSRTGDALTVRFTTDERHNARFLDSDVIPVLPDLEFSGLAVVRGTVRLDGSARFDSLRVLPLSRLIVNGALETAHLSLGRNSMLVVDGVAQASEGEREWGARLVVDGGRIVGTPLENWLAEDIR